MESDISTRRRRAAFVRLREEPRLAATFGEQYERYRANVPRWVPRLVRGTRNADPCRDHARVGSRA